MSEIVRALTPAQLTTLRAELQRMQTAATSRATRFTFFAAFDGTNNDRANLGLSGTPQQTNVGQIETQTRTAGGLSPETGRTTESRYYQGVGTGDQNGGTLAAGPAPTAAVMFAAERGLADFARAADQWLNDPSNPGRTIADLSTAITGFSRGAGTAIVFAQLLNERGLVIDGRVIAPPGTVQVSAALLLDPVITGIDRVMTLPGNMRDNIFVLRALDETRYLFPAADFSSDPRVQTFKLPGNHGNIGGFYDNGIGAIVLESMTDVVGRVGIRISPIPSNRAFDATAPANIYTEAYDSIMLDNGEPGRRARWGEAGSGDDRRRTVVPRPVITEGPGANVQNIQTTPNSTDPDSGDSTQRQVITFIDGVTQERLVQDGRILLATEPGGTITADGQGGYSVSYGSGESRSYNALTQNTTIAATGRATTVLDAQGIIVQITEPTTGARETVLVDGQIFNLTADGTPYRREGPTTLHIADAEGQSGAYLQLASTGGVSFSSAYATRQLPDGTVGRALFDNSGRVIGLVLVSRYDDGSYSEETLLNSGVKILRSFDTSGEFAGAVATTTYPNGRVETLASNADGTPANLHITIPAGNNTETVDAYTFDASGQRVFNSSTTTETFYDENGQSRIETVTIPFGGSLTTTRQVYDTDGVLVSSTPVVTGSQANANVSNPQTTAVLNDISGLISAIQGGQSLPILNSGVRLINTVANPAGSAIQYPGLNQASGALNGLASLYNLSNALQNGSDLDKLSASLNTLNYVNSTLPTLLSGAGAAPLSAGLNGFLNGTGGGLINGGAPGVIPVLGLIISIKNGDPIGTISGIIGIVNPALLTTPVGWILAIASIVYALNKETPESWGTARIIFDANGNVGIDTVGDGSGPQRVRQQLDATLAALNQQIDAVRLSNPAALIGIVPQRTPSITWREQRQDDQGYAIVDIDPVTGQQRYPYLRFDDAGVPFSSNPAVWQPDPRDPGIRVRFDQQLTQSALRREAIAPQWVVDTARIQQDIGDPNAGLVEQERAAKLGLGAAYDAVTKEPTGQFRPITLDLDGNGTITIAAKDAASNTVAFDWNDSGSRSDTGQGFLKQVAWVQPNDGFLFVDRNLNGVAEVTGQALNATEIATCLIASPAIFYWARGLKDSENRAENDDCWRNVA
jgi:Uncharacterized alpha/beta hydrolase domain (DUF2235)